MLNRHAAGVVALGLGTLGGCHEPAEPAGLDADALFRSDARASDSLGGDAWRQYLRAPALHRAWAPDGRSPWRPYYRATLPAAVSVVASAARPVRREDPFTEGLLTDLGRKVNLQEAALFVDLAGEDSVAWGARLALQGHEPVATFNNWPHARGVLKLERPLGAMIYYAAEVERARAAMPPPAGRRPVFLLEGTRLQSGRTAVGPDIFDNRYFHVASDFPTGKQLTDAGVRQVVYVRPPMAAPCEDDLVDCFVQMSKGDLKFHQATVEGKILTVVPWSPSPRTTVFTPGLTQTWVSSSRTHGRSYYHYHRFWSRHQGTWGRPSSGGGGSGGSRYS